VSAERTADDHKAAVEDFVARCSTLSVEEINTLRRAWLEIEKGGHSVQLYDLRESAKRAVPEAVEIADRADWAFRLRAAELQDLTAEAVMYLAHSAWEGPALQAIRTAAVGFAARGSISEESFALMTAPWSRSISAPAQNAARARSPIGRGRAQLGSC